MIERLRKREKVQLFFNAIAMIDETTGYASASSFNGLFRVNFLTGASEYVDMFPDEGMWLMYLHFRAEYCNKRIFFFPQKGKHISVYDLLTESFTLLDLPETDYPYYSKSMKIAYSFVYQNSVFAIGASYPAVIEIDPETMEMKTYPYECNGKRILFRAGGTFCNGCLYVPSLISNLVLCFGMQRKTVALLDLPDEYPGAWSVASDGRRLWFAPRYNGQNIICFDIVRNKVDQIKNYPKDLQYGDDAFLRCLYKNRYIWMFPEKANMALKINPDTFVVEEVREITRLTEGETFGVWFVTDHYLYGCRKKIEASWIDEEENVCFKLDLDTLESTSFCFYIAFGHEIMIRDIFNGYRNRGHSVFREGHPFSLRELIMMVGIEGDR